MMFGAVFALALFSLSSCAAAVALTLIEKRHRNRYEFTRTEIEA
jgi:NADH:ubiquinone oxidoreductase subunit K